MDRVMPCARRGRGEIGRGTQKEAEAVYITTSVLSGHSL